MTANSVTEIDVGPSPNQFPFDPPVIEQPKKTNWVLIIGLCLFFITAGVVIGIYLSGQKGPGPPVPCTPETCDARSKKMTDCTCKICPPF